MKQEEQGTRRKRPGKRAMVVDRAVVMRPLHMPAVAVIP